MVVDFIQSNLAGDLPLLALAELANVSAFHFARQFRATVGLAPHQFVLRQRIQKSLGLMTKGRLPLAQIAPECGFHDQAHFTRAFRMDRVMGVITDPKQMDAYSTPQQIAEVIYEAATDGKDQLRYVASADAQATYAARLQLREEA